MLTGATASMRLLPSAVRLLRQAARPFLWLSAAPSVRTGPSGFKWPMHATNLLSLQWSCIYLKGHFFFHIA